MLDYHVILDEVFGAKAIKALHNFLPKLSEMEEGGQLITLDAEYAADVKRVIKALSYLFRKHKTLAARVAINETVNFSEKLAPFIDPKYSIQSDIACCLRLVMNEDNYNCHLMNKFLQ